MVSARNPLSALGRTGLLALVLMALGGLPRAAAAATEAGAAAPPLVFTDDGGLGVATLAHLRGRAVLVEFFSTSCPHCRKAVAHLDRLAEAFRTRGVVVLATSRETPSTVRTFAQELRVKHVVTASTRASICDWGVTGVPALFLVLPNGRIGWQGRTEALEEAALTRALERIPSLSGLPEELAWVPGTIVAETIGEAARRLAALPADTKPAVVQEARRALAFCEWYATSLERQARRDVERGRSADAVRTWEHLGRAWAGTPRGEAAARAVVEVLATPAHAREVEADRALRAAEATLHTLAPKAAAAGYEAFGAAWAGTQAASRAGCQARDLVR